MKNEVNQNGLVLNTQWIEQEKAYQKWIIKNDLKSDEIRRQREMQFSYMPKIKILTAIIDLSGAFLDSMLHSVISQTYQNWELCAVQCNLLNTHFRDILESYSNKDKRIKNYIIDGVLNKASLYNTGVEFSDGEFTVLLDDQDVLNPDALFEILNAINQYPDLDILYSDHEHDFCGWKDKEKSCFQAGLQS